MNKYKELDRAQDLFENGLDDLDNIYNNLRLVAIYIRRNLNCKPKVLKETMYQYCENNIIGYKREKFYPIINKAINQAIKKGSCLINVESIPIYKEEVNYINSLKISDDKNDYLCKKLMFSILCRMKLNREIFNQRNIEDKEFSGLFFKGGNKKYGELKRQAKLPSNVDIDDLFYLMNSLKLVTPMYEGLIRFDFVKNLKEIESTNKLYDVSQFEDIGWYYDLYMQDKTVKQCSQCGKLIKIKGNRQIYCDKCADEIESENAIERKRKQRERENVTI